MKLNLEKTLIFFGAEHFSSESVAISYIAQRKALLHV